jgi:hypothetical protein
MFKKDTPLVKFTYLKYRRGYHTQQCGKRVHQQCQL